MINATKSLYKVTTPCTKTADNYINELGEVNVEHCCGCGWKGEVEKEKESFNQNHKEKHIFQKAYLNSSSSVLVYTCIPDVRSKTLKVLSSPHDTSLLPSGLKLAAYTVSL
jgi:hypothetical protein